MRTIRRQLLHVRNALTAAPLAVRPGHYYSPICDPKFIANFYRNYNSTTELPDIDLRRDEQLKRWQSWLAFTPEQSVRFVTDTRYYCKGDAICLHSILRELRPQQLIEIGCGHSSVCALNTISDFGLKTACTFIDPNPDRFREELERHTLIEKPVQQVDLRIFDELQANDVLFIDSTHVMKTGSDVHHELFEILPRLKSGVFIHFHDIFFPFEYPPEWVIEQNYSWNETYAVRALVANSARYKIEFWNDYLAKTAGLASIFEPGASLWISVN